MDLIDLRNIVTAASFLLFCGLVAWTWLPRRRASLDAAANLVFEDEADLSTVAPGAPVDPSSTASGARP